MVVWGGVRGAAGMQVLRLLPCRASSTHCQKAGIGLDMRDQQARSSCFGWALMALICSAPEMTGVAMP